MSLQRWAVLLGSSHVVRANYDKTWGQYLRGRRHLAIFNLATSFVLTNVAQAPDWLDGWLAKPSKNASILADVNLASANVLTLSEAGEELVAHSLTHVNFLVLGPCSAIYQDLSAQHWVARDHSFCAAKASPRGAAGLELWGKALSLLLFLKQKLPCTAAAT